MLYSGFYFLSYDVTFFLCEQSCFYIFLLIFGVWISSANLSITSLLSASMYSYCTISHLFLLIELALGFGTVRAINYQPLSLWFQLGLFSLAFLLGPIGILDIVIFCKFFETFDLFVLILLFWDKLSFRASFFILHSW